MHWNIKMYCLLFGIFWSTIGTAQWVGTSTPAIYHLYAIDVVSENVVYAGGYGGSLVKTIDGGLNWNAVPIGSPNWILSIQFEDENIGLGEVLKTTDGGLSWTTLHDTINCYAMQWTTSNIGYVGGEDGVFLKTIDGGQTWTNLSLPSARTVYDICFLDTNNGYLINTADELLKTTDGGLSWTSIYHYGISGIDFRSMNEGHIISKGLNNESFISKTTDGGATFTMTKQIDSIQMRGFCFADDNNGYVIGGLYCGGGSCTQRPAIFKTTDGGLTWVDDTPPHLIGQVVGFFEMDITPSGIPFISGSNATVFKKNTAVLGVLNEGTILTESMELFPNPTNGAAVYVNAPSMITQLEVVDLTGRLVKQITDATTITSFSIQDLPAGVYRVHGITTEGIRLLPKTLIKRGF
ncbi:YCF48-related protein [Aureispira anguillae]|uniref:YCF48-related protein n=1 Tax=Aureispira anguillae TaxID=2864201 RepID=A0A916DW81_9BACT|nr:YCF48-related protein [Aureispira anguillae]BDS14380.1 YCF48-related protein [Aureispira anguillae]